MTPTCAVMKRTSTIGCFSLMKWFDSLHKSTRVFLTMGIIFAVTGFGYDDYELKLFAVIFLLSGLASLVARR